MIHTVVQNRVGYRAHAPAGLPLNAFNFGILWVVALPQSKAFPGDTGEGTPWYHVTVDVLITTAIVAFCAMIGGSHLMATWILRKDFDVAKR